VVEVSKDEEHSEGRPIRRKDKDEEEKCCQEKVEAEKEKAGVDEDKFGKTEKELKEYAEEEEKEYQKKKAKEEPWSVVRRKKGKPKKVEEIKMFRTVEPGGGLNAMTGEWEVLEMAVDSAATETVLNDEMVSSVETKERPASRRGVEHEVANGVKIPIYGED